MLLAEYRRAFFMDPGAIMSLEVFANILRFGGPGYIAIMAFIAGFLFLLSGLFLALVIAWFYLQQLLGAVMTSLSSP